VQAQERLLSEWKSKEEGTADSEKKGRK
jgi:hypothetical protein